MHYPIAIHLLIELTLSISVANYYLGKFGPAQKVIETYLSTLKPEYKLMEPFVVTEMYLFIARMLEEQGKPKESLEYIEEHQGELRDKTGVQEKKGELYLKLGQWTKAKGCFTRLLKKNPENYSYHSGLQVC